MMPRPFQLLSPIFNQIQVIPVTGFKRIAAAKGGDAAILDRRLLSATQRGRISARGTDQSFGGRTVLAKTILNNRWSRRSHKRKNMKSKSLVDFLLNDINNGQ